MKFVVLSVNAGEENQKLFNKNTLKYRIRKETQGSIYIYIYIHNLFIPAFHIQSVLGPENLNEFQLHVFTQEPRRASRYWLTQCPVT